MESKTRGNRAEVWALVSRSFVLGDSVVLLLDIDTMVWGVLQNMDAEGVSLGRKLKCETYRWDSIRFMSHDGFPVKKLLGADGSLSVLTSPKSDNLHTEVKTLRYGGRGHNKIARVHVGDPWCMEGEFTAILYNPGLLWTPEIWRTDDEETVCLEAKDGAQALLWDVPTIFYMELTA